MAEVAVEKIVDPYEGRYLGRTKPQKERERTIRDDERAHLVSLFSRLGDGRQSRKIPKEKRAVYREVAALIDQHQDA